MVKIILILLKVLVENVYIIICFLNVRGVFEIIVRYNINFFIGKFVI